VTISSLLWFLGILVWLGALVHCALRDREERHIWLFVILFLNVVGALLYLAVRVLPGSGLLDRLGAGARLDREIRAVAGEIVHLGEKPHLLARLGALKLEAGALPEARELLERALAREDDLHTRFDLARALERAGDGAGAAAHLQAIIERDRSFMYGDGLRALARLLVELARHDEAAPICAELARTRPSPETRYLHAVVLEARGDKEAARKELERLRAEAGAAPAFARYRQREWLAKARALERRIGA